MCARACFVETGRERTVEEPILAREQESSSYIFPRMCLWNADHCGVAGTLILGTIFPTSKNLMALLKLCPQTHTYQNLSNENVLPFEAYYS